LHVDDNGINAPFAQGSVVHSKTIDQAVAQPWVVLVLALCVGALVIATSRWWGNQDGGPSSGVSISDEVVTPQAMAPVVIPAPPTPEPKAEAGGGIPAPTSVVEPTVATVPSKPVSAADAQFASSALGVTQRIDLRPVGTTSQPTPGSEVTVSFKARQQPVWVEVVDAKGEVRLRRNVGAGEKVECGGVPPLAVVVGRADSLDMEVRGKPFDFAALAKDNVARFEVK
jgi:cytoskeleton protein RodZ